MIVAEDNGDALARLDLTHATVWGWLCPACGQAMRGPLPHTCWRTGERVHEDEAREVLLATPRRAAT